MLTSLSELDIKDPTDLILPTTPTSTARGGRLTVRNGPVSKLDDSDTEPQSSDEDVEKLAKLAKKLESHRPFINLLAESFKRKWPENDKGVDKKPKGGYAPPKSAVPSDSTRTSSKRRSMDHEPDDQPGPSKRSKT